MKMPSEQCIITVITLIILLVNPNAEKLTLACLSGFWGYSTQKVQKHDQ